MKTDRREEIELQMENRAQAEALNNARWLTMSQISEMIASTDPNPDKQLSRWKSERLIFFVDHNGVEYYPSYEFDEKNNWHPLKVIEELMAIFHKKKSGWGIAFWCQSPNSYLGGSRPKDVLAADPESVLKAARHEAEGILHG